MSGEVAGPNLADMSHCKLKMPSDEEEEEGAAVRATSRQEGRHLQKTSATVRWVNLRQLKGSLVQWRRLDTQPRSVFVFVSVLAGLADGGGAGGATAGDRASTAEFSSEDKLASRTTLNLWSLAYSSLLGSYLERRREQAG